MLYISIHSFKANFLLQPFAYVCIWAFYGTILSLESHVFSYITIFAFSVLRETLIVKKKGEIESKVEEPTRAFALRTR